MHVCMLTTSFPLYEGIAIGIHVAELSRHLVKLGVKVDVLAPHHRGAHLKENFDGINVSRFRYMPFAKMQTLCYGSGIPTNLKNNFWARLQLPFFFFFFFLSTLKLARKCDIIHAHWSLAGLVAVIAGKIIGKPVVLMMHGAEVFVGSHKKVLQYVIEQSDYVLCNSSFTMSMVEKMSRPENCVVISPGVDIERFHPNVNAEVFYRREPDIPHDRPLLFALGKFIERKGFSFLLEAVKMLDCDPEPFLMIGGRGPLKEKLIKKAKDIGISDRVKFLDYIPDNDIPSYYKAADIFILPSIVDDREDTEGLGVVLLESLSCETPCIASEVGGITDVVVDCLNGLLVKPGDSEELCRSINDLLKDSKKREIFGKNGRKYVREIFSWPKKAEQVYGIYKKHMPQSHKT